MAARMLLTMAGILLSAQSEIWPADATDAIGPGKQVGTASVMAADAVSQTVEPAPYVHASMEPEVRAKLEAGLAIASDRLGEIDACSDLFSRLGADGINMLNTGRFFQVNTHLREVKICGRNGAVWHQGAENLAYTRVGGSLTWICRHFARVSDEVAAVTVIHEALHHAGLTEWPSDRLAMTTQEITRMVRRTCDF